jgi:phage gp36-like protein
MSFITDEDYTVQAKQEILNLLDPSDEHTGLRKAEKFAIAEIKKRIGGRYDMNRVFEQTGDNRDEYIVMITIDIAIYHLYSQKAPRKIPEYRDIRYHDALEWLTSVGKGETPTDLPPIDPEEYKGDVRIFSLYAPNNHKY